MLILTRNINQGIVIKDKNEIRVMVLGLERGRVKLGIEAPKGVLVLRDELEEKIDGQDS